ncbi:hypothetical protein TDB9533_03678 [Thalassocella blandensis]|nr:hypothetical protein TDB9533_03678 [Thalassocella blandensis]
MTLSELEHIARQKLVEHQDEEAYQALMSILQIDPEYSPAYYLLSLIAHKFKNYEKEVAMLTQAHLLAPDNLRYKIYLASAKSLSGEKGEAANLLKNIALQDCDTMDMVDTLATTYNRLSLYRQACEAYQFLVNMGEANPFSWFNLGSCYKYIGDFSASRNAFLRAIQIKPDFYKAHAALASVGGSEMAMSATVDSLTKPSVINASEVKNADIKNLKHKDNAIENDAQENDRSNADFHIAALQQLLNNAPTIDNQLYVAHALAKVLDRMGRFDEAFSILAKTKQLKVSELDYESAKDQRIFDGLNRIVDSAQGFANHTVTSLQDVFIVGMPRSGTTLLDRILSGVSGVQSGGELYAFGDAVKQQLQSRVHQFIHPGSLSALNTGAYEQDQFVKIGECYQRNVAYLKQNRILTNKLPANILYAHQIMAALPNAVVICMDRHPLDTIIGNYRQLFSFDDEIYRYSLNLEACAKFYVSFQRFMQRMAECYSQRFYVMNYQNLVTNPEDEVRALMDFCCLPWNKACLNIENNLQPVATASSVQVREAIHSRSIGHWKHYKQALGDAEKVLHNAGIAI